MTGRSPSSTAPAGRSGATLIARRCARCRRAASTCRAWKTHVGVNIEYHLEFDHHYYSVPYQLVGKVRGRPCHRHSRRGLPPRPPRCLESPELRPRRLRDRPGAPPRRPPALWSGPRRGSSAGLRRSAPPRSPSCARSRATAASRAGVPLLPRHLGPRAASYRSVRSILRRPRSPAGTAERALARPRAHSRARLLSRPTGRRGP